jgi:mRNA interferase MazF
VPAFVRVTVCSSTLNLCTVPKETLPGVSMASVKVAITLEQETLRQVVILSQDIFNARSGTVVAVALTSQAQKAGYPLTLELKVAEFRKHTWAKISQIRTLSVQRIGKRLARIPAADVTRVIEGQVEILGQ